MGIKSRRHLITNSGHSDYNVQVSCTGYSDNQYSLSQSILPNMHTFRNFQIIWTTLFVNINTRLQPLSGTKNTKRNMAVNMLKWWNTALGFTCKNHKQDGILTKILNSDLIFSIFGNKYLSHPLWRKVWQYNIQFYTVRKNAPLFLLTFIFISYFPSVEAK